MIIKFLSLVEQPPQNKCSVCKNKNLSCSLMMFFQVEIPFGCVHWRLYHIWTTKFSLTKKYSCPKELVHFQRPALLASSPWKRILSLDLCYFKASPLLRHSATYFQSLLQGGSPSLSPVFTAF